ncbi:MAG: GHKL domain-containing protein [Solobacterium sp.]|nr:GHKL domain-containing protein [Solobacterium sp.]
MADAMSKEDRQRIYEDMEEDASWLKDQMENILAMTRLGSDGGLNLSVESAGDVIAESLRHIRSHPDHVIRYDPPAEDCLARMDAKLIMQVLINLLDNAVKHTPAGTEVTVTAEKKDGLVEILVADTGQGIPDAEKENIFDLFYIGRHTLSDSSRSMGIGLNLCQEILKAHGGTIEVTDNQPHGTVFRLRLKAWEVQA